MQRNFLINQTVLDNYNYVQEDQEISFSINGLCRNVGLVFDEYGINDTTRYRTKPHYLGCVYHKSMDNLVPIEENDYIESNAHVIPAKILSVLPPEERSMYSYKSCRGLIIPSSDLTTIVTGYILAKTLIVNIFKSLFAVRPNQERMDYGDFRYILDQNIEFWLKLYFGDDIEYDSNYKECFDEILTSCLVCGLDEIGVLFSSTVGLRKSVIIHNDFVAITIGGLAKMKEEVKNEYRFNRDY